MDTHDPGSLAAELLARPGHARVTHVRIIPAHGARTAPMPGWVPEPVREAFGRQGVRLLWEHQARTAQALHTGRHTILATGTASGKSQGYLLPILSRLTHDDGAAPLQRRTSLYLSPTKALAADQASRVTRLGLPNVLSATYDGDTPTDERRRIRRHAALVLTNPDMLHHGMLPAHEAWSSFWRGLEFVVVDECHAYRGLFGSHVAAVLRRLRRVAARYGADPTFAFASATVADPARHARDLCGLPVQAVTEDGSPRPAMTMVFVDPVTDEPATQGAGETLEESVSALSRAGDLLADLVERGVQTVVFARSRLGVEVVADRATARLDRLGLGSLVAAYRGGYLPEERRELEDRLRSGQLRGLAATSALELGIDISGLDAVVMAGWPGTRTALWQRAGRAGRSGRSSLTVLLAGDDPLDHYLVRHPEAVLDHPVEACTLDPANPYVLRPHLAAAAAEVPLRNVDAAVFGSTMRPLADELTERGLLRRRRDGWYWTRQERPADLVTLRGAGSLVTIVESPSGRVLGTVDVPRADAVVHTGSVYVHQQRAYVVTRLDLDVGTAVVVAGDPGWRTQARTASSFDIIDVTRRSTIGAVTVCWGSVRVRRRVTSFVRRLPSSQVLGEHPLDLPDRVLNTSAVWWTVTPQALQAAGIGDADVPGAAHAAEHAAIGLLPLVATADRWDIGGVSSALHPDTGLPTVMVYDGHAGGAGIAERGYADRRNWLQSTRQTVALCRCERGCPACVQSPKCGNANEPLDKLGAVALLDLLLTEAPRSVAESPERVSKAAPST
ncbi:MAG: DEAD/DEAH box helicase [Micrococcales bacterium]|nr:DEAD/DEAH box helicase [Micrococcales bacterium]